MSGEGLALSLKVTDRKVIACQRERRFPAFSERQAKIMEAEGRGIGQLLEKGRCLIPLRFAVLIVILLFSDVFLIPKRGSETPKEAGKRRKKKEFSLHLSFPRKEKAYSLSTFTRVGFSFVLLSAKER